MANEQLSPEEERDALYAINSPAPENADDIEGEEEGSHPFAQDGWTGADRVREKAASGGYNQAVNKLGFFKKNKKWLIGGGAGFGLIIPIALFFFWLMLFKNVHIKNLYVTYRWAQFNRGLNKALKAQLEYAKANPEAKATGSADSTVNPDDPIDKISSETNSEFDPDKIDPEDPAKVEAESKKVSSAEQSIEGSSEKALNDAGASRNVKAAEGDGATPEERAKSAEEKAKKNVEEDIAKAGENPDAPPDALKDAVEEAKDSDKPPKEAASDAAGKLFDGGGGWKGAVTKISDVVFVGTIYCIFHDLYTEGKDQLNKIALSASMGTAQEVNKTADCQKNGECDATQIGAVAEKYDNGTESFTDSCGYKNAEQSADTTGCKPIDPRFTVDGILDELGGGFGVSARTADAFLDPPINLPFIPGDDVDTMCSAVMNAWVQAGITLAEGAAIIGTDGGWKVLAKGVATGAATFAGTAGGKALIASFILKYTGGAYKDLLPTDMGNLTDMGNMATASATCASAYCPSVSDQQLSKLDREYRAERIAANAKRSTLEKFFDNESPDSVVARVALNAPSTPGAMMGRMKKVMAAISNPAKLLSSAGNTTLAFTRNDTALADDSAGVETYGLSGRVRVPPNLIDGASSYADVVAWSKTADLSKYSKYDKCSSDSYADQINSGEDTCSWDGPMKDDGGRMYMQYKYLQNVAYKNALARNNQSTVKGPTGSGAATEVKNTPGPVFMLGDSITVGMNTEGKIADRFAQSKYTPTTIDASSGREFNKPGLDGPKNSGYAALQNQTNINAIKSASYVVVGLGTNPVLKEVDMTQFNTDVSTTIDKIKAINSNVKIYWLNVISPLAKQKDARNAALSDQAAKKGFTIIDATGLSLTFSDQIHPYGKYDVLSQYVVDTIVNDTTTTGASGAKKGVDTSGMACPAGTADKGVVQGPGVKIKLCDIGDGTEVNASAAKAFYDMKQAAAAAGVQLSGGGYRSNAEQIELRKKHCGSSQYAIYEMSPSQCSPPTAKPGRSNHEEGLAVDFRNCSRGSAVFNWLSANASKYGIKNLPSEAWHWSTSGN